MREFLVHHSTSIYNMRARFTIVLITLFLSSLSSIVKAQSADSVEIPAALRIDQYGHRLPVTYQREFALDVLQQGNDKDVFPGPPCLEGEYYVGFQLEYDLADRNTLIDWKSRLEIAFLHGTDTLWKKPLQVDMKSQTFIATVFHDTLISCDGQYHFYVASKTSTGTVPLENIYLKVLLHKSISDVFNPTSSLDLDCAYTDHKTQLSWKYTDSNYSCDAVIAHDIEWVFIDNYDAFNGTTALDAFNFTEPIRITTDSSSHYTHQVYYPDGRIWYRIRAVGTNPQYPGHRLVGQWFYSAAIPITNQQGDLNWQQQTVFAEEGKYKKVISYFDGSLRQRQVLTNLSSEHLTLVGESLYDFEGRQSASILAVPALDSKLAYKANFNVFSAATDPLVSSNTSDIQHKFNYDNNRLTNTVLSNQSGASKYYSNQNANGGIHSEFIPDAEGYVYSQTEFRNDGTGRVSRQSGVGEAFNLEGDHATQYYYGGATQAELIRLFGNNVGQSSHYKKNLVVDPNGQVSVSYLDQEGRTIATALAGESPDNVKALDSLTYISQEPLVEKIGDKNKREDGVSRTVHTFLNVVPNTVYTFSYDLQALGSQIEALGCKTCTYDLKITITDPDGLALDLSAAAGNQSGDEISYQRKNITAASCTTATVLNDVVIVDTLRQIGDYTITKTLTPAELTFEQMQALVTQDTAYQNTAARINQGYVADPDDCAICTSGPLADQAVQDAIHEIAVMDCENIYQQILSYYRNLYPDSADFEPTNEQITQHPLYCKYQLCKQNTASDVFDKTLATKTNWSAAMPNGYVTLADSDPFFNVDSLGGHGHKLSFLGQLNDIQVASVGYDSDGDGEQDGTTNYHGSIENVTNPANTDYYINDNGVHDAVDGKHILYMDIMSKRTELADTSYQKELDKQHWLMYQSFYLNAKRKAKMSIPAYQNCSSAMDDLNTPDALPTHPDSIAAFAIAHGVTDSVSTEDIQHQMYALNTACDITFSAADSTSIANHLKSYFSSNTKNLFKTIIKAQVHVNTDLVAINTTLSHYNCSLDSVALDDPLACADTKEVSVSKALLRNGMQAQLVSGSETSSSTTESSITSTYTPTTTIETGCQSTHQDERDALIALYNSTRDSIEWTNSTNWNTSSSLSNWYGVIVDTDGYVTRLNLGSNNLNGTIPMEIGNLCHLDRLMLDNNIIKGNIPPSLANLIYVDIMNLSYNKMTGVIPDYTLSGGYSRSLVDISNNKFYGQFPSFGDSWIYNLYVENNNYTFNDLFDATAEVCSDAESNISSVPQNPVDITRVIHAKTGRSFTLTTPIDRNIGCYYQWYKNGAAIGQTPEPILDAYTITIPNATAGDAGDYYVQITNPDYLDCSYEYVGLILQGRNQAVVVSTDTSNIYYDICEYDTANTTIKKLSYTLDINKEVAACMERAQEEQTYLREYAIDKYLDSKVTDFYKAFQTKCLNQVQENLQYEYVPKEYHYTLYYFDQGAGLVQTVPPNGVHPLSTQQVNDFIAGTVKANPSHKLITRYNYSSLSQLIWQKTPDAGESNFWYNDKGQLKLSQNAQQANDTLYSYTRYDALGRIAEVGELSMLVSLTDLQTRLGDINFPANDADIQRSDITSTHYDLAKSAIQNVFSQQYLRNRVSWVDVVQKNTTDTVSTYYNYDIHGNVKSLQQQLPGFEPKQTQYLYDLISGKVNYVMYQYGKDDQFIHQYTYDSDNRITDVHTSTDGYIFVKEATYSYYLHGPLARVELGQYRVQAQDYYYTLQGWIKGVNTPYAGNTNALDYNAGRDVYAYALGYYENDYKPVDAAVTLTVTRDHLWSRLNETMNHTGLYNGNISWMVTDLSKIGEINHNRAKGMQAMLYKYDQLHRIVQSRSLTNYNSTTGFGARGTGAAAYDEDYSYDPNGNIMTLQRHNETGALADDFIYQYYANSNKLRQVKPLDRDKVVNGGQITTDNILYRNLTLQGSSYTTTGKFVDIKAQENITMDPNFDAREGSDVLAHIVEDDGTFQYDKIGNLILDQDQGVQITWTPYGKVREVHTKGDSLVVDFKYDGTGNRIEKTVTIRIDTTHYTSHSTRYLRDAGGNVMAIYKDSVLIEQPIYGSSRIGEYEGKTENGRLILGERKYELGNHLGNILAIIHDNINMHADSTWVTVINSSDYYPFGLEMKGRVYNDTTGTYRYGFNGKEKDKNFGDVVYDYGFRIYNPTIAKFLSVDPLTESYPWYTSYSYAGNNPIRYIDMDGLETNEPLIFWDWDIDMNGAPDKYKGPLMKTTQQSSYVITGYARNSAYYWNKVLEKDPSALDKVNSNNVRYGGKSPVVTKALIDHIRETKGIDLSSYEGQTLEHHHWNQGRTAVAIPSGDHNKFSGELHQISREGKVRTRSGTIAGRLLGISSYLTDITGYMTGNPHNVFVMFSKPKIGNLMYDGEHDFYYTIIDAEDTQNHTTVTYQRFSEFRWDKQKKKYVGQGYIDTKTETYNKESDSSTNGKREKT
jgi:RHS repeat-associated protein